MSRPPDVEPDRVETLTEIWRRALDNPDLDADSDVFQNGGTSLHVLQVAGQIYQQLGTNVSLRDVFTHTTPRALAQLLDDKQGPPASTDGTPS